MQVLPDTTLNQKENTAVDTLSIPFVAVKLNLCFQYFSKMLYFSVTVKRGIPRYDLLYASTFIRQMPGLVGNCEIANKLRKARYRFCKPKRDLPVQAFSSSLTLRQALHNLQVYNACRV